MPLLKIQILKLIVCRWPIPYIRSSFLSISVLSASIFTSNAQLAFAQEPIQIDTIESSYELRPSNVAYWLSPQRINITPPDYQAFQNLNESSAKKTFFEEIYDRYYRESSQLEAKAVYSEYRQARFESSEQRKPNFGVTSKPVWYAMRIENQKPEPNTDYLLLVTGYYHDITAYQVKDGHLEKVIRTGSVYPLDSRHISYPDQSFAIPLHLEPGTNTLLIQTFGVINNPKLEIFETDSYHQAKNRYYILLCMCIGSLLGLTIYNFCIFVISKQLTYIFYVCYMLTELCFLMYKTHIYTYLFPLDHVVYWRYFFVIGLIGGLLAGLLFIRSFLKLYEHLWINRAWKVTFALVLTTALYYEISGADPVAVYIQLTLGIYSLQFILGSYLAIRGNREAIFYLIAFSVFIFSIIIYAGSLSGLLEYNLIVQYGAEIGAPVQALLLSLSMADKIRLINLNLESYIGKIETIVDQRTRHINSFLKHIKQGIFDVLPGGVIGPYHSEHCQVLLGIEELEGKRFFELLRDHSDLNRDQLALANDVLNLSLGEDELNFYSNSSILPTEIHWQGKVIDVNWQAISNSDGEVEKIMVVAKDISDLRQLEKQNAIQDLKMQRIERLISIAAGKADDMLRSLTHLLEHAQDLVEPMFEADPQQLRQLYIDMHTMKGISRTYNLQDLTEEIHATETLIQDLQENAEPATLQLLKDHTQAIASTLTEYKTIMNETFGDHSKQSYLLTQQSLLECSRLLGSLAEQDSRLRAEALACRKTLLQSYTKELSSLIEELKLQARTLGDSLGKLRPQINLNDNSLTLTPDNYEMLSQVLGHLLRNSLDHGLETTAVRQSKGKDPQGIITIAVERDPEKGFWLRFSDDGAGINLKKVYQKAVQKGMLQDGKNPSAEEIVQTLLSPGFSTATAVTHISGRGVGLDAVAEILTRHHGRLELELGNPIDPSSEFRPLVFSIYLPDTTFELVAA